MQAQITDYYKKHGDEYRLAEFDKNTICAAYESNRDSFFRVEVKKVNQNEVNEIIHKIWNPVFKHLFLHRSCAII